MILYRVFLILSYAFFMKPLKIQGLQQRLSILYIKAAVASNKQYEKRFMFVNDDL